MGINEIIVYIMMVFLVIGAIDKLLGNKFGYGEQFEEGFMAMGALALAMVGAICLAPVLANVLKPVIVPIYKALGADPSMFATTLLACDMGGYQLAGELAENAAVGQFAGLILGAMMGPTIVFTIPVALGIIKKEDQKYLAKGVLAGIITVPIGTFVGGLLSGLPALVVLQNLTPIIIVALLIVIGLKFAPDGMIKGFTYFGKFITIVITIGLVAAVLQKTTGLVLIKGMAPIEEGLSVVGDIVVILAGAYPLVHFITKVFKKPLMKVGSLLKINDVAAAGMIASLANSIPMFGMMKDMDERGKIINVAFAVSAAFVFGDHLGFAAGVNPELIAPMIVGKLVGGVTAVIVAVMMTKNLGETKKA
ncbi:ethanolamine utilization protein EutH [Clostridium algidicarnis]|uniref:ethanolamine utilization protein EutH n=1 Tax=Clostridium algidicarnis TaxID=37659 RepID=UPI001C0DF982|nr:ethanolamine utilization protein EutH [Clostridium algidicarnis]MBU3228504.1 ethanolamine utilization protein EutH [Clostridium algidicarnis]MBU3252247.1 ethanolamine utilization protein EutH [Clostridium algidicarnis]